MTLQGLSAYCDINLPGLRAIYYAPVAWVNTNTYERIVTSAGNWQYNIQFTTGDWLALPVLPQGRTWTEQEDRSLQGKFYEQQLTAVTRPLSPAASRELDEMSNHRFLLKVLDRNAQWWLLGTMETPFDFSASAASGEERGGLSSYSIRFESQTPHRAYGFVPVFNV